MKITFNIDYRTNWGESVYISGNIPELGNNVYGNAVEMTFDGESHWCLNIELPKGSFRFHYRYIIRRGEDEVRREWGLPHSFLASPSTPRCLIYDKWQDMPTDKPFYSSAFTDCICKRPTHNEPLPFKKGNLTLSVEAPLIKPDETLAVCGSLPCLGGWNPDNALRMNDSCFPRWEANIPLHDINTPFEYKFIIIKTDTGQIVAWEGCDNRRFEEIPGNISDAIAMAGLKFVSPLSPWRGAGVAIPVFSLRSDDDCGVGDFYDLLKMVDWAAETGQRVIQILPINDTTMTHTWTDSYPYNANSIFALHPMYLRLTEVGIIADEERRVHFAEQFRELNMLQQVDYERVNNLKNEYIREIFAQEGKTVVNSSEFQAFIERNREWLMPYAAFCVLRDINGTPDMTKWGEYSEYDRGKIEQFTLSHPDEINLIYYTQYHLDKQMTYVRDYAHSKGIALKGDIPIGISRTSADAWVSPRLFNLGCQAGAPPDDFSVLGQNWGLPTYNWEEMGHDGFAWWKARFRKMAEYFDAYRIDHVLGFFRIWQIPMDAIHGLLGIFNPALPFSPDELRNSYDFWIDTDLQTRPYIMDWFLNDFFGEYTDEARSRFLDEAGYGRYHLKQGFDTQRKVAEYFAKEEKNEKNNRLCDALMGLIDNVLFIEDPVERGKFHPRISAQYTYIYRSLTDYERWCFNRLYNDFFYHRHNDFWYGKAMWKLPPLIDSTDMLVCAEDLGMIPGCVPAVMNRLEILALEIQRMPKDPKYEFGDTWQYPYYSVCTTSTHDMGGIRQWWEEDCEKTQHYYNNVLHEPGNAPFYAEPWICDLIVTDHLKSPSMLCILPLQDWLSINGAIRRNNPREEQINVPANSRHYWRYRMHLTMEELLDKKEFNSYLLDKIRNSGR